MNSIERTSEFYDRSGGIGEILVDNSYIEYLLEKADNSERKRYLVLLHRGDSETSHMMINTLLPETTVRIHRHEHERNTEYYWPIEGEAAVLEFNDEGGVTNMIMMGGRFGKKVVTIKPFTWHTVVPLTPFVMLENKGHPEGYRPETDKVFAPWAPAEGTPEANEYFSKLRKQILEGIK